MVVLAGILLAGHANAEGVNLSWDHCRGDGGTQNRTFACDTNAGTEVLVCSFVLDQAVLQATGNEIVIEFLSEATSMPAWWEFRNPGTCRRFSLNVNLAEDPNDTVCRDWGSGQSQGGIGAYNHELGTIDPSLDARHRRLKIAVAVPLGAVADLVPDTEYFSCNIAINHANTVGDNACGGCTSSLCMFYSRLIVTALDPANDQYLTTPAQPGSDTVHWQGPGADCQLVPVKRTTWGQVKGLYR